MRSTPFLKGLLSVMTLLLFAAIGFHLECSHKTMDSVRKINVSGREDVIEVSGTNYYVTIDKVTGELILKNPAGSNYTSFPIAAQFDTFATTSVSGELIWTVNGREISMEETRAGLTCQKVMLKFYDSGFEIQFGLNVPEQAHSGVYCFRRGQVGFQTKGWDRLFSPEPDEYYSQTPMVDVQADRDKQWFFTPAPLNVSFETPAGWFSIGLATLPPVTRFGFVSHSIWMDYPWVQVTRPPGSLYWLEPLVFTFNASEWQAVGDYRTYLIKQKYFSPPVRTGRPEKDRPRPDWWLQPLVSTWGEQMMQKITHRHSGFNSQWVKEYVEQQSKALPGVRFTLVIEDQWTQLDGEPFPSERFRDLRELIDWCHGQGHKVVLWWRAWAAEANSWPQTKGLTDGNIVDATHPEFENYVKLCCQIMLDSSQVGLNADGIKLESLFLVRDPHTATYRDPAKGMGLREVYRYMKVFYETAKRIKPEALIIACAPDPHFEEVQDMVRINDDWDNKLRREKRARIMAQALPDTPIDGSAADMYHSVALYHYVLSSVMATPAIYYYSSFHDGAISDKTRKLIAQLVTLAPQKGWGQAEFLNYGWWRWKRKDQIKAESLAKGTAVIFYLGPDKAILLSTIDQDVPLLLEDKKVTSVKNEQGEKVDWVLQEDSIYFLKGIKNGQFYYLEFKRVRM